MTPKRLLKYAIGVAVLPGVAFLALACAEEDDPDVDLNATSSPSVGTTATEEASTQGSGTSTPTDSTTPGAGTSPTAEATLEVGRPDVGVETSAYVRAVEGQLEMLNDDLESYRSAVDTTDGSSTANIEQDITELESTISTIEQAVTDIEQSEQAELQSKVQTIDENLEDARRLSAEIGAEIRTTTASNN